MLKTALERIAEMGDGTYCITSTGTVHPYGHDETAKVCGGRYIVGEWRDVRSSAEASKRISESGKHLPLVVGYWEGEYDLPYGYDDRVDAIRTAHHYNQKAIFDTVEGVCFDA